MSPSRSAFDAWSHDRICWLAIIPSRLLQQNSLSFCTAGSGDRKTGNCSRNTCHCVGSGGVDWHRWLPRRRVVKTTRAARHSAPHSYPAAQSRRAPRKKVKPVSPSCGREDCAARACCPEKKKKKTAGTRPAVSIDDFRIRSRRSPWRRADDPSGRKLRPGVAVARTRGAVGHATRRNDGR